MFEKLKGLQYGARIRLYQNNQRQTLDVGGKKVGLLRAGEGEPLVYLHSVLGENVWLPFHQGLARDFQVIAPDGFADDGSADWDDISFHYLDILDSLELDRVHLVGVSRGGWEAAEFALRYRHRVSKLVLANAFGLWIDDVPVFEFWKHSDEPRKLSQLMLERPDSFLGELLFPGSADSNRLESVTKGTMAIPGQGLRTQFYDPKLLSRLERIKSPTLVLWGAADKILPEPYARAFHKAIPNSLLHLIPDCGHLPMFEQEARFVSAVSHFLKMG
jgi:pimeloyl-ACP methyl ester carboxylesterase